MCTWYSVHLVCTHYGRKMLTALDQIKNFQLESQLLIEPVIKISPRQDWFEDL